MIIQLLPFVLIIFFAASAMCVASNKIAAACIAAAFIPLIGIYAIVAYKTAGEYKYSYEQIVEVQNVTVDGKTIQEVPYRELEQVDERGSLRSYNLTKNNNTIYPAGTKFKVGVNGWAYGLGLYFPNHLSVEEIK